MYEASSPVEARLARGNPRRGPVDAPAQPLPQRSRVPAIAGAPVSPEALHGPSREDRPHPEAAG